MVEKSHKKGYWRKPEQEDSEDFEKFFSDQFRIIIQHGIKKRIANNEELAPGQITYMEKLISKIKNTEEGKMHLKILSRIFGGW